ncbi:hypothetical protein GCM10010394_48360 [Streptomyces crystallinus]|uniref:Uncharacterized protein n=1 Tax=Streptomyces crystallinus TaxID=68191 RepID=A0ABN1GJE9_9ACTN
MVRSQMVSTASGRTFSPSQTSQVRPSSVDERRAAIAPVPVASAELGVPLVREVEGQMVSRSRQRGHFGWPVRCKRRHWLSVLSAALSASFEITRTPMGRA